MNSRKTVLIWFALCIVVGFLLNGMAAEQTKPPAKIAVPAKIDLNRASAEQIGKCPGLSAELAKAIVAYREKSGPFKAPEDLLKVKGITKDIFNKIKPKMEKNMLYLAPAAAPEEDEEEPSLAPSKC
jgi:competence protein ComEA